eukprot:1567142-Amphidinium_carterae.1
MDTSERTMKQGERDAAAIRYNAWRCCSWITGQLVSPHHVEQTSVSPTKKQQISLNKTLQRSRDISRSAFVTISAALNSVDEGQQVSYADVQEERRG